MIYFDNAATSKYKPGVVYDAFMHYVREIGTSPGRGSYSLGESRLRECYIKAGKKLTRSLATQTKQMLFY